MAQGSDGSDPLLTMDVVREFILSKGGKVQNHELVAHFRNFLNDPVRKVANRQKIKVFVNTLAVVKLDTTGEKVLSLKKKYRESGNFDGDPTFSAATPSGTSSANVAVKKDDRKTSTEKIDVEKESTEDVETQDVAKKSQSCDNLTEKNVGFEDKEDYVLISKSENRSKSLDELNDETSIGGPLVSPCQSQDLEEVSQEDQNTPVEEVESVSHAEASTDLVEEEHSLVQDEPTHPSDESPQITDQPDGSSQNSLLVPDQCSTPKTPTVFDEPSSGGVSVKEFAKNLNKIESESQTRPSAPKTKRENRKPVQNDDSSSDYSLTFTEVDRAWLMAAASCDYMVMLKMLQTNPELARKKDFITGYAPIHWAAKHGKVEVIKLLYNHNVDVNVRTRGGYTALHLAAMQNHLAVVELLVNVYRADTNIRDYNGKRAKQCMHQSATTHMTSLLQSRRPGSIIQHPESPAAISQESVIGKAMFLGLGAVGGLRISSSGKENTPLSKPGVVTFDENSLMPPPRDLPPVARKAKPTTRQKETHSDSEMPTPVSEQSLHGSGSNPNFGTVV